MRRRPVELRPEPGLVRPAAEVLHPVGERAPLVLLEEEPRVGEPGAQHALVAVARHLRILHRRAGDRDEAVLQGAAAVDHREVALVVAHLGDDDLGGELEVRPLELARDRGGMLDEEEHLLDERLVGPDRAARLPGGRRELLLDGGAALGGIDDHLRPAELRDVVVWRPGEPDRLRSHEAVAVGDRTGDDVAEAHLERPPAVEREDPAERPREGDLVPAPAHRLPEAEPGDEPLEELGEDLLGLPPLLHLLHRQPLALGRLRAPEARDVDALAPREAERGLGRVPRRVEGLRRRAARGPRSSRPSGASPRPAPRRRGAAACRAPSPRRGRGAPRRAPSRGPPPAGAAPAARSPPGSPPRQSRTEGPPCRHSRGRSPASPRRRRLAGLALGLRRRDRLRALLRRSSGKPSVSRDSR